MISLTVEEVLLLQAQVITQSGGKPGVLDLGLIDSAVAQPQMTFGGQELYPTLVEKAAAIGYSLACNHGFADGNKRIGHAAMETFLVLNGYEIDAPIDEQEAIFLQLAAGQLTRPDFVSWIQSHIQPLQSEQQHGA
jgi:death on curing protein